MMKKLKILVILLFYFKIAIINAEGVGFNAGGNFANLNSEQAQGNTNSGLNGGLRFDIPLVEGDDSAPIRFSPEIFIKQAGSNEFISTFQSINYQNLDLTYIGLYLPISFSFSFNPDYALELCHSLSRFSGKNLKCNQPDHYMVGGQVNQLFIFEKRSTATVTEDK